VARIFITGSTDGLGRGAAGVLIGEGHEVVLHARTRGRAAALRDLAPAAAGVVIGDLSSAAETRELADQVNKIGRMDTVIHNAGVFLEPSRSATAEGHAKTLAVNTLAPKMGGPAATGDLEMGYLTQTWLAVSDDAAATASGGYWYHRQRQSPAAQALDPAFQDQLMDRLAALTGIAFS
jgi:NAD(P)-dependent dehydrogenase (short-subunit alcohol dehydrogenase family)